MGRGGDRGKRCLKPGLKIGERSSWFTITRKENWEQTAPTIDPVSGREVGGGGKPKPFKDLSSQEGKVSRKRSKVFPTEITKSNEYIRPCRRKIKNVGLRNTFIF